MIYVEENRFEKKMKQLQSFKNKHLRPKRTRAENQSQPEESVRKRMKLFKKAGNPDLGAWLKEAEE